MVHVYFFIGKFVQPFFFFSCFLFLKDVHQDQDSLFVGRTSKDTRTPVLTVSVVTVQEYPLFETRVLFVVVRFKGPKEQDECLNLLGTPTSG